MGKKKNKQKHKKVPTKVKHPDSKAIEVVSEDDDNPLSLHHAAKNGNLELVDKLIKKGYEVNYKDFYEQATPLMLASIYGHVEVVHRLLAAGADIELSDIDNVAPLQAAGSKNYVDVVEVLVAAGANTNKVHKDGALLLYVAAALGYVGVIKALLKSDKTLIDIQYEVDGKTPLSIAAFKGHVEIVNILLSKGANVHIRDINGITALHSAAAGGYLEVLKLLTRAGSFINAVDGFGRTALLYAANEGQAGVVKLLIEEGADVTLGPNKKSKTPLSLAIEGGHIDIVKILIAVKADVNFIVSEEDNINLLDLAIASRNRDIVSELINSPMIRIVGKGGSTPLHLAAELGYAELIPVLLDSKKVNINHRNVTNKATPILIAAAYGNIEAAESLLGAGADVEITDKLMMSPLHIATVKEHVDMVKLLLTTGVDVNARGQWGYTALHLASSIELTKLLLKAGANPFIQDNSGMIPLQRSKEKGHKGVIKILQKYTNSFPEGKIQDNILVKIDQIHIWHKAIKYGKIEIIKPFLLSGIVGVNTRDHTGSTALHYAAYNGYLDILELLMQFEILNFNMQDYLEHFTPLHLAACNNKIAVIDILLRVKNIRINTLSDEGTAICSAVLKNSVEALLSLIKAGADIDKANVLGHTPLHAAVHKGQIKIIEILLQVTSINANLMDADGRTPLMHAIISKRGDIVDILVRSGKVDINFGIDAYPIHLAVISKDLRIINSLLSAKAIEAGVLTYNNLSVLHFAAYCDDVELIKMLVRSKMDSLIEEREYKEEGILNFFNKHVLKKFFSESTIFSDFKGNELAKEVYIGSTPLHVAINYGRTDIAITLINLGINFNTPDKHGVFPIHLAISKNNMPILNALITSGRADVNLQSLDKGATALHCAVEIGNIGFVKALLETGKANADILCWNGITPFFIAIKNNNLALVKLLAQAGADINLICKGLSPLNIAIMVGNQEIVEFLIESEKFDYEGNLKSPTGKITALHIAAGMGHLQFADILLKYGFNINAIDCYGASALHVAVSAANIELVKILLLAGINLDIANKDGITALHIAAIEGDIECLTLLIDNKADINAQNKDGLTALGFATVKGYLEIAEYLIKSGADLSIKEALKFRTVLHMAAEYNHLEILKLLLYHSAEVNLNTIFNSTPLHLAAINGNVEAIDLLVSKGARINSIDTSGETALHYAAFYGHLDAVKRLVELGADINIRNEDHHLAADLTTLPAIKKYFSSKEKPYKAPDPKPLKETYESKDSISYDYKVAQEPRQKLKVKRTAKTADELKQESSKDPAQKKYTYAYNVDLKFSTKKAYTWNVDGQKVRSDSDLVQKTTDIGGGELYVMLSEKLKEKIDSVTLKKIDRAISNGFVGPVGENGIKNLKNKLISVKITGDLRIHAKTIYLNPDYKKLIIFNDFCKHGQLQDKINESTIETKRVDASVDDDSFSYIYNYEHDLSEYIVEAMGSIS